MSVKKLRSFTLMEVMVTMFISAILIGMSYFLFQTIRFYFQRLDTQTVKVSDKQLMRFFLREDLEQADSLFQRPGGLLFYRNNDTLSWSNVRDSLVRNTNDQGRQAFFTGEVFFNTQENQDLGLINQVQLGFTGELEHTYFLFYKTYPINYYVR